MASSRARKTFVSLMVLRDGVEGAVRQFVVKAVVAESSGALGKVAQIGFVLLVEKCALGGDAVGHRFDVLSEGTSGYGEYEKDALV